MCTFTRATCDLFMDINLHYFTMIVDWQLSSNCRPTNARIGPSRNSNDIIVATNWPRYSISPEISCQIRWMTQCRLNLPYPVLLQLRHTYECQLSSCKIGIFEGIGINSLSRQCVASYLLIHLSMWSYSSQHHR